MFDGLRTFIFVNKETNKMDGWVNTRSDPPISDQRLARIYWEAHHKGDFSQKIVDKLAKKFNIHQFWIERAINRPTRTWENVVEFYKDYGYNIPLGHIRHKGDDTTPYQLRTDVN